MLAINRLFVIILSLFLLACDKNNDFVIFSVENDKELGAQVAAEIEKDPDFAILSDTEYPEAYSYLRGMRDEILASDNITYREEFVWKVHILHDDTVLNAFATPGGYIYLYTGLIKFLDKEDDLSGVLAHEIAHADQRHSSKQLQRQYGVAILLSVILGQDPGLLAQIVGQITGTLAGLSYSRNLEEEADEYSVIYLADAKYACNGAYTFFQKLIDQKQTGEVPEFLSTHPDPEDRIQDINLKAEELGCSTDPVQPATYDDLLKSLP